MPAKKNSANRSGCALATSDVEPELKKLLPHKGSHEQSGPGKIGTLDAKAIRVLRRSL